MYSYSLEITDSLVFILVMIVLYYIFTCIILEMHSFIVNKCELKLNSVPNKVYIKFVYCLERPHVNPFIRPSIHASIRSK